MNYELYKKMIDTNGKFFTVKFFKRSDGSLRTMNCRLGVKKDLKGTGPKYNALKKELLTVYDVQAEAYRNINLNCVLSVTINGEEYHNENVVDDIKELAYKLIKEEK